MKVIERIADSLIRQVLTIDESQFEFVPGNMETTDAIFVIHQLQEKYLATGKWIYMAFLDLEKAFDLVPRKVIWWAMRKLDCETCSGNERSRDRVGEGLSNKLEVRVGVHKGSVL